MDSKIGIIGKRCNTLLSDYIADLPEVHIEPIEPKFDFNNDYLKDAKIYCSTTRRFKNDKKRNRNND